MWLKFKSSVIRYYKMCDFNGVLICERCGEQDMDLMQLDSPPSHNGFSQHGCHGLTVNIAALTN